MDALDFDIKLEETKGVFTEVSWSVPDINYAYFPSNFLTIKLGVTTTMKNNGYLI